MSPTLVGRYSAYALAFTSTVLPRPELHHSPFLYSCFQHATQPLLCGVQTREASIYRGDSYCDLAVWH